MYEQKIKDPDIKLKMAETYATVANYWKFYDGETKQLKKFHTYEQKQQYEQKFSEWAKGKPGYENIFTEYAKNYDAWTPYSKERQYLYEGILGSPLAAYAASLVKLEKKMVNT